jgi:hypothetical protein
VGERGRRVARETSQMSKPQGPAVQQDRPGAADALHNDVHIRCAGASHSVDSASAAGPRRRFFHDPAWTRAAIVTCGGLCPGINNVIKLIVNTLWPA